MAESQNTPYGAHSFCVCKDVAAVLALSYILAMCSHLFISAAHKTHQGQLTLTQAISALVQLSVRPCRRLERWGRFARLGVFGVRRRGAGLLPGH